MSSRVSSATAASTAAIMSGSGGSGMYSLAPAWMAATAARASVCTPQATIGTWMCSASSLITRSRMSSATSTIRRSAPLPERSTAMACSLLSACVTAAPLSMAIFVAVVSWPLRVPTIRRRMGWLRVFRYWLRGSFVALPVASVALGLDDFGHSHAELVLDQHHLAARHQAVVDVDVDRLADLAVELEHCAGAEIEQLAHVHVGAAEHGRDLHRHVEHRIEVGRAARARLDRRLHDLLRQRVCAFEVGKRDLIFGHLA